MNGAVFSREIPGAVFDRRSIAEHKATSFPRVLVTGAGGQAGLSVMTALCDEEIDLFSADDDPHALGLYLVGESRRLRIPGGGWGAYTEWLYELCESHRIDVLIPAVDRELVLLSSARSLFAGVGTKIVLPSEETLRMCVDRWALHQRCEGTVRVPRSWLADEDFDPCSPRLPVIVKQRMGDGSREVRSIEQRAELERIDRGASLLIQEHLPGPEYALATFATTDGRVMAVIPSAQSKVDSGGGCAASDEVLRAIGRQIAERIGLTSVASIQLKETSDGELALLNVKTHFPEMIPPTAASWVNLPMLCVDDALGLLPSQDSPRFKVPAMTH